VEDVTILACRRGFLALLVLAVIPASRAQSASESAVKAALLYKLASYVEWPADPPAAAEAPFTMGVMGADDVAAELELVTRGRTLNNRPISVRRVKEGEPLAGLSVLFVSRRDSAKLASVARLARPLSILLVSDSERGLDAGSVINFVAAEDRIGFEVSIDAAERSNLKLSSRMLGVARRVLARTP
jgi:hypothetical protein